MREEEKKGNRKQEAKMEECEERSTSDIRGGGKVGRDESRTEEGEMRGDDQERGMKGRGGLNPEMDRQSFEEEGGEGWMEGWKGGRETSRGMKKGEKLKSDSRIPKFYISGFDFSNSFKLLLSTKKTNQDAHVTTRKIT